MADKSNGATTASKTASGSMTKAAAVRQAFRHLGKTAMPVKVQSYLKDKFHIDMSTNAISTYKTEILRKAGRGKPTAAKVARTKPASKKAPAPKQKTTSPQTSNGKVSGSIPLADVQTLKSLLGRVNATNLKALIDVLSN